MTCGDARRQDDGTPGGSRLRRSSISTSSPSPFRRYGAASTEALRDVDLALIRRRGPRPRRRIRVRARRRSRAPSCSSFRRRARSARRRDPLRRAAISRRLDDEALRKMRGRDIAMIISNPRGELDPLQTVGQQIGNVATLPSRHSAAARSASAALDLLRAGQHPRSRRGARRLSARAVAAAWRSAW